MFGADHIYITGHIKEHSIHHLLRMLTLVSHKTYIIVSVKTDLYAGCTEIYSPIWIINDNKIVISMVSNQWVNFSTPCT